MADLSPGQVLANRYRVDRQIGVGGMGSVYEAWDGIGSQRVAVKVLHQALLRHPVIPKRFVQEAMAARALTTPHAVKVEGTGSLPDGCPFIVMEYLDGLDLGTLVRRAGGKLGVERVVRLADQIASALEEAHAKGIVHRDLKPENIFVLQTAAGEMIKVVDFGISKILTREDGIRLTQTGTTLGTPQYMAMEQLRGAKDLDGRVDVYALGVMLYEVLSGVRPYDGFTYEEVIMKVATTVPAPLSSYRNDLPPALVELVSRAMHRDRDARIGSMTEIRRVLAELGVSAGRPSGSVSMERSASWASVPALGVERPSMPTKPARKLLGWMSLMVVLVVIGLVGVLVAAGGAGVWFYVSSSSDASAVKSAPKPRPKPSSSATTGTKGQGRQ
jgi:serine/threonine-protein kinase